ncbi:MAG: Ig-like domain-containing protein, partial [Nitrososphaeraceae archaeon]
GGGNTNEKIEYTPAEGFFGNDEFTYTIIDRNGATDSSRVTVTVNEVILAPHPIIYWLENEGGITQDLLEKAAEGHDNNNNDDDVDEWSFNLGNFRVPVEFDVSDSENDTKGILEGGGEGNNNNDDDNTNAYDQLAAQLLTSKLNIENGVSTCESIETTIEYADTVLRNALYDGPGSTENPISESRDYAFELIENLDRYNNEGCV